MDVGRVLDKLSILRFSKMKMVLNIKLDLEY